MNTVKKMKPTAGGISTVQLVQDKILGDIESGRVVPGQRLITADIASEMGTSLAPVREAFHILAGEGLLELLPNRGARVRTLSTHNLLEAMQVLQVVGALAINQAAQQPDNPRLKQEMDAALKKIMEAGQGRNAREFFRAISLSHRLMNEMAGNSYLNPVVSRLHLEYCNSQLAELLPGNWDRYIQNYSNMDALLEKKAYSELEHAWVEHAEWVMSLLRGKIQEEAAA